MGSTSRSGGLGTLSELSASERPTHVLTPRVGLSEFSRRQAALKQELAFALLAVDGRRP
jgi:hypothetical protein